jgi:hypothetical protein
MKNLIVRFVIIKPTIKHHIRDTATQNDTRKTPINQLRTPINQLRTPININVITAILNSKE